MKRIFWGFFFVFINFNLSFNAHTLNLIPTFVGYILLYQAAGELTEQSSRFKTLRPFAAAMAVYTGLLWVGELLGVAGGDSWLDTILGLAAAVLSLIVSWNVVQAILEMESARGADLNGASVRTAWFILCGDSAAFRRAWSDGGYRRTGGHHLVPGGTLEMRQAL